MAALSMKTCLVLLVISPFLSLARVTTFNQCPAFFMNGGSPTILTDNNNNNRYQQICQCRLDQNGQPIVDINRRIEYFYATLYDTQNKIPVYSAYILGDNHPPREDHWYVEPQLDGSRTECMGGLCQIPIAANRGQRQALNRDYDHSGYDKGHLYPVSHTSTRNAMLATFTLTNAAPQNSNLNRGRWSNQEAEMLNLLNYCTQVFMVTGVVPDGNVPPVNINNRVVVAEYYWSAYCCLPVRQSEAYIGPINGAVEVLTVQQLEGRLTASYGQAFTVFTGGC